MNIETVKWPKTLPVLTAEQERIRNEYMADWHKVLPQKYKMIENFNHNYPLSVLTRKGSKIRTLEIGAGLGGHIHFEDLSFQDYHAMELREEMASVMRKKFPRVTTAVGDVEKEIPYAAKTFDRVVAVHVLEHLPNLPKALDEVKRVLKDEGQFTIVIPCEGGMAYTFAREISAKRRFVKKYRMDYDWFVKSEHVNTAPEILEELKRNFVVKSRDFFPLKVPIYTVNLCIGLDLKKKS